MVFYLHRAALDYLSKHLTDYFEYIVREFFFHILTVDAKRPKKLVNDVLHFSVHSQAEEILYLSTTCLLC